MSIAGSGAGTPGPRCRGCYVGTGEQVVFVIFGACTPL